MLFDRLHPSQQVPNKSATTVPTRTDVYLYQETDGESDETYTPHMMGDTVDCDMWRCDTCGGD
jgi:hypothetical protein